MSAAGRVGCRAMSLLTGWDAEYLSIRDLHSICHDWYGILAQCAIGGFLAKGMTCLSGERDRWRDIPQVVDERNGIGRGNGGVFQQLVTEDVVDDGAVAAEWRFRSDRDCAPILAQTVEVALSQGRASLLTPGRVRVSARVRWRDGSVITQECPVEVGRDESDWCEWFFTDSVQYPLPEPRNRACLGQYIASTGTTSFRSVDAM